MGNTHRSGYLNRNPRHADVGAVEVLDSLGGIFWSLEADISNPSLSDQFDVCDLCALAREVFAEIGLSDVGREILRKYPGRLHLVKALDLG
jgi:hypothetical protein